MTEWLEVSSLKQLERSKKQVVTVGDQAIVLFHYDGEVYALLDACIHKGRSLARGLTFKGSVICPGHQWAFDLKSGWVDEWALCQPTFAVKVDGDRIFIDPAPRVHTSPPPECDRLIHKE